MAKIHKDVVDFMFDNDFTDDKIDVQMRNVDYLTKNFYNLKIVVSKDFANRNKLFSQFSASKPNIKIPLIELKTLGKQITDEYKFQT